MPDPSLTQDIASLEASLDAPSTPAAEALADSLAHRLLAVRAGDCVEDRERAVRGLMLASHQFYRSGAVGRAHEILRAAVALAEGIPAGARIAVLLRTGEMDLLTFDIGGALGHTAAAMEIARAAGQRVDEARAWVNYGAALDSAGLYRQADEHWAHALHLLEGTEEARLRGNIWALRCPLGFRLGQGGDAAAAEACRRAYDCALAAPLRYRDSMASTALCNWAALDLQRGRVAEARAHLERASALANLGARSRWLVAVLRAMADVRQRNEPAARAAVDALLHGEQAPAAAYVIETLGVMAAMFAHMGDGAHAAEMLAQLSAERSRALWAMLRGPQVSGGTRPHGLAPWPAMDGAALDADDSTSLLERLAVTAELRDDATGKHCFRVGRLARLIGARAGIPESEAAGLELAARLHDIGKIVIPDAILLKPGRLDATEMHLMQSHTTIGAEILAGGALAWPGPAREIARHHHERWDGTGYPDAIAAEVIPLAARVAAIADVYDALTHDRPYKRAWSHDEAMAYIAQGSGSQFDPGLTRHFVGLMGEAGSRLAAFLDDLESAAAASAYVQAQARVAGMATA